MPNSQKTGVKRNVKRARHYITRMRRAESIAHAAFVRGTGREREARREGGLATAAYSSSCALHASAESASRWALTSGRSREPFPVEI